MIECVQMSLKNHIDSVVTLNEFISSVSQERINQQLVQEYTQYIQANERQLKQVEDFKRKLYENLVSGMISKGAYGGIDTVLRQAYRNRTRRQFPL